MAMLSLPWNRLLLFQAIDERFYLVFPGVLVILAVGQSLSGYELQVSLCVCVFCLELPLVLWVKDTQIIHHFYC